MERTNLILATVDEEIARLASTLGLQVTRYLDNIDFSGPGSAAAIQPTIAALQRLGLAVAHKKVFNRGGHEAHVITGLTVNGAQPSVSRKLRDRVRAACHEVAQASAAGCDTSYALRRLRGRLAHIRVTNPGEADRLVRRLARSGIAV